MRIGEEHLHPQARLQVSSTKSLALPFKAMVASATSVFSLAQKFPASIFFILFFRRNGMRLLVLSPQDSREACMGVLVTGNTDLQALGDRSP